MLSRLLERYDGSQQLCHQNKDCDALVFGKLARGLKKIGLDPIPEPSSLKRSIEDVFSAIRSIELSPLCWKHTNKTRYYRGLDDTDEIFRHLDGELQDSLSRIENNFQAIEGCDDFHEDQVRT